MYKNGETFKGTEPKGAKAAVVVLFQLVVREKMILFTYIIKKVCQNFRAEKANYEIMKIGKDEYFDKWPGVKVKNENSKSKLRRME